VRLRSLIPLLLFASLSGCAQYEFDVVRPTELARHIDEDREQTFKVDPLEYRMQAYEGRLVVKIYNPTGETITLLGQRSSAVDPHGESHPLLDAAIAPSSWVKLILPPMRPRVESSGPNIGLGFGIIGDSRRSFYSGYATDPYYYDEPRYYDVYIPNDSRFWDWDGETDVRLLLVYQRAGAEIQHAFTFHRRKM
jgi:hypothetical protein